MSGVPVCVSSCVRRKLELADVPLVWLVGVQTSSVLQVVGALSGDIAAAAHLLPLGLHICGVGRTPACSTQVAPPVKDAPIQSSKLQVTCTCTPESMAWTRSGAPISVQYDKGAEAMDLVLQNCARFRIKTDIQLRAIHSGANPLCVSVATSSASVCSMFSHPETVFTSTTSNEPATQLKSPNLSTAFTQLHPVSVTGGQVHPAPSLHCIPHNPPMVCSLVPVHLDLLSFLSKGTAVEDAMAILRLSLTHQIQAAASLIESFTQQNQTLPAAITFNHYQLPGQACPLTAPYPAHHSCTSQNENQSALQQWRAKLHTLTGTPTDRPYFRISNAMRGDELSGESPGESENKLLRNVDAALQPAGVKGGSVFRVSGSYNYHHYMQDNFNDSGWGCAYRSLQTIWSWFILQGFTGVPVPSHRDIQMTLAKLGDKPSSFVGSKQWVGAVELGIVLQESLGLDYRIITASKGSELPDKAREIAEHFRLEGTPIMMGGGVLAYTLLGIDWNEDTGAVAFLILDPHYTGPENIDKITAGTWVAWKKLGDSAAAGGPLFAPNAFYNLLCPQRPRSI